MTSPFDSNDQNSSSGSTPSYRLPEGLQKTVYDLGQTIKQTVFVPVNAAGWPFIVAFAVVSVLLAFVSDELGLIGLVLTLWCVFFFRDPVRAVPQRDGLIVSPADGRVMLIREACKLPVELGTAGSAFSGASPDPIVADDGDYTCVSIFLSVFDVHVNRVPVGGTVEKVVYRPGSFLNAADDRASFENERSVSLVKLPDSRYVCFVQIAGLVARRIINTLQEGQTVATGDRHGLIRFGSRVDIYLPAGTAPLVSVGQTMIGGESIIADLTSTEKERPTKPI